MPRVYFFLYTQPGNITGLIDVAKNSLVALLEALCARALMHTFATTCSREVRCLSPKTCASRYLEPL